MAKPLQRHIIKKPRIDRCSALTSGKGPQQACPRCLGQLVFEDTEWAICLNCDHRTPCAALESLPADETF